MPRKIAGLDGQRFFLTYPQSASVGIDELADFLTTLPAFEWLEIAQENHKTHGIHYHVVLCFSSRFRGSMQAFDFAGRHPNVSAIRNATVALVNSRHYIRKGDRSEEEGHTVASHKRQECDYVIEPDTRGAVPPYIASTGRLNWGGILAEATSESEFLALVRVNQPKDWILRNDVVRKYGATHFKKELAPEKKYPVESWHVPAALDDWVAEVFSEVRSFSTLLNRLTPVRFFL